MIVGTNSTKSVNDSLTKRQKLNVYDRKTTLFYHILHNNAITIHINNEMYNRYKDKYNMS